MYKSKTAFYLSYTKSKTVRVFYQLPYCQPLIIFFRKYDNVI